MGSANNQEEFDPMKLHSTLKPTAVLTALVLLTGYAGSVLADDASTGYTPPVQTRPSVPKDPVKAERKADKKAAHAADRHLAAEVRKALVKAGEVDTSHVSILAKSGAITLAGTVPKSAQIGIAQQQAQQVAGVARVTNRLGIDYEGH
jgi:hyperosmotically inducible periplasmic protein